MAQRLDLYLHDTAGCFRVVVRGELVGDRVAQLEHTWTTARSILNGRSLVDVSGVQETDACGRCLLSRMRDAGATLIAQRPNVLPRGHVSTFVLALLRFRNG